MFASKIATKLRFRLLEAEVEVLLSRRFDELKLVIIYVDGMAFGDHVMIGAVGVMPKATNTCWPSAKRPDKTS